MSAPSFRALFEAIHGQPPFPWQERLAADVIDRGAWPDVLDLPTGSGKTACIDVALLPGRLSSQAPGRHGWPRGGSYSSWIGASSSTKRRSARRRSNARFALRRAVCSPRSGHCFSRQNATDARRELHEKSGTEGSSEERSERVRTTIPFDVFTLRGGVARERNLAREPLRVSIVLSTVDQIGSRLLFRGYGVSPGMLPIHAGLFGVDTLLLLDEAHIAGPFRQTLEEHRARAAPCAMLPLSGPRPLHWAQLTATPTAEKRSARVFSLDVADWKHPVLSRRLTAKKPMRLLARRQA